MEYLALIVKMLQEFGSLELLIKMFALGIPFYVGILIWKLPEILQVILK